MGEILCSDCSDIQVGSKGSRSYRHQKKTKGKSSETLPSLIQKDRH